uniref:Rhotekin 2 n=1 Tax=Athene cunicularia TaxID=194338 RepID=A0A663N3Z8_ATHCN
MIGSLTSWRRLYCVLRGGKLFCYYSPEEIEAKLEPTLTVSIHKETRIRAVDKDSKRRTNNFSVINPVSGEAVTQLFATDSRDELHKWMERFNLMKHEGLADIVQRKIEESDGEFLLGQQKDSASSLWASLFDGSHEMVVQKNMNLSPKTDTISPNESRGKKRRAPPPPSDKPPYSAKAQVNTEQSGKENWEKSDRASASSFSFDSKLPTKMQQLTPIAAPRKIGPCRKSSLAGHGNLISLVSKTESETKPVPTPRQKCITEMLDPRSWLQP